MVKVICQHSKIEFDASSERVKQHPSIATLKAKAKKDDTYSTVMHALDVVRKGQNYNTIEEYVMQVQEIVDGVKARQRAEDALYAKQQQESKQRKENEKALLSANGYRWSKITSWETDQPEWVLSAPDGRDVTVRQALDEIARGVEVVQAERAAQAEAAEKEATEKEVKKAQDQAQNQAVYAAFDAEVSHSTANMTEVERFNYWQYEQTVIHKMAAVTTYHRRHDHIVALKVNDVDCIVMIAGTSYDDDGYSACYCADPDQAGLPVKQAASGNTYKLRL